MCNSFFFGGMNLGFAIGTAAARHAQEILENWWLPEDTDFRSWNYGNHVAWEVMEQEGVAPK